MKTLTLTVALIALSMPALAQNSDADMADQEAVKDVIVSAYVEGMHINSDAEAALAGFHPEFIMHVARDGEISQVTIQAWTSRLSGEKNENEITHEFEWVDVTGKAAKAKLLVYSNGTHIFTDYMGLYKVDGEWKIVNKIFESHR